MHFAEQSEYKADLWAQKVAVFLLLIMMLFFFYTTILEPLGQLTQMLSGRFRQTIDVTSTYPSRLHSQSSYTSKDFYYITFLIILKPILANKIPLTWVSVWIILLHCSTALYIYILYMYSFEQDCRLKVNMWNREVLVQAPLSHWSPDYNVQAAVTAEYIFHRYTLQWNQHIHVCPQVRLHSN